MQRWGVGLVLAVLLSAGVRAQDWRGPAADGERSYQAADYPAALDKFSQAIQLNPREAALYRRRADTYTALKRYREALADTDQGLRLNPGDQQLMLLRATCHDASGDPTSALADFGQVVAHFPNDSAGYLFRGDLERRQGLVQPALADLNRAVSMTAQDPLAREYRARLYTTTGRYTQALADNEAAVQMLTQTRPGGAYGLEEFTRNLKAGAYLSSITQKGTEAIQDAQNYIRNAGWQDSGTPYMVMVEYLASEAAKDPDTSLLDAAASNLSTTAWPVSLIAFLRHKTTADAVVQKAHNVGQATEAHCWVGLQQVVDGQTAAGRTNLEWVVAKGTRTYWEYSLAKAALARK